MPSSIEARIISRRASAESNFTEVENSQARLDRIMEDTRYEEIRRMALAPELIEALQLYRNVFGGEDVSQKYLDIQPSTKENPYGLQYGGDYILFYISFIFVYIIQLTGGILKL